MKIKQLISIVIPVYNMEKYLTQCLESVISQTYHNLEIICINDGSTDNSLKILKKFQQKDNRIKVYTQKNKGSGIARNQGIFRAKGKFIYFIDPDDFFPNKRVLSLLYKKSTHNNAVLCGGSIKISTDPANINGVSNFQKLCSFQNEGWIDSINCASPYGFWRFLYQTEFLLKNHILFPPYRRYQDVPFFLEVLIKSKKFYAIKQEVYVYRVSHKVVTYNLQQATDLIKGIRDCLIASFNNNFQKIHTTVANTINNKEYCNAFKHLTHTRENFSLLKELIASIHYPIVLKEIPCFSLYNLNHIAPTLCKIAVIILIYNTDQYIERCLRSVCSQTYENIEILCINNGLTENSLSILKKFQRKDLRISIINLDKKELSEAKNIALQHVTSDYVTFISSNDYIDPNYLEVMHNKIIKEDADFCVCNILAIEKNCQQKSLFEEWNKLRIQYPINPNRIFPNIWGKLFKMSLVRKYQLNFPIGFLDENLYWHFLYSSLSAKYSIVPERLYYYGKNDINSTINQNSFIKDTHSSIFKIICCIFDSLNKYQVKDIYYNYLDTLFFDQLDQLLKKNKVFINKNLFMIIKEYLMRSEHAEEIFKKRYYNILDYNVFM